MMGVCCFEAKGEIVFQKLFEFLSTTFGNSAGNAA